jgi:hypothetical protein
MKRTSILFFLSLFCVIGILHISIRVFAEQSGTSPESGSTSRIKEAYDWLVAKGTNYGATDAADWTNDWGTYWNRLLNAAAWEPDGTATAAEMPAGLTFYGANLDRTIQTGTLYTTWLLQAYDDVKCAANNGESSGACAASQDEYTGEEGTWTLTSSGGSSVSVTDNAVTVTITSNKVYRDNRTYVYWTDRSASTIDNEFAYVNADDRSSPTGNSCNFNSASSANTFCDNQDPLAAYAEDNDVSAAEFCLNLALDADNADADSNGTTGTETDWRLPTQKEAMIAYVNGSENNLANAAATMWTSTELGSSASSAWQVNLGSGIAGTAVKNTLANVSCVRP